MKKYALKIVVALLAIVLLSVFSSYNRLVQLEESRLSSWGDVENSYQRRNDLIPNLVNVVKGSANYEQTTLIQVIEARAKATSVKIESGNLNLSSMQNFQKVQEEISSSLSKLLVVVEKYPDLQANKNFLNLQEQLEGTENRIAFVREAFNKFTRIYNIQRRKAITSIWVKYFYPRFEIQPYFQSQEGAENAPVVDFSNKK